MALSNEEVQHIAMLADLAISPDEVAQLVQDLGAILAHVEQLNELDTRDVPPTAHLAVLAMPLGADVPVPGLDQATATGGAPRAASGAFAVPKFMEE
jgi:aspartyl-tRNA(Asn)/glutamyl-tRNA(Gln) amidotransferase subunit C